MFLVDSCQEKIFQAYREHVPSSNDQAGQAETQDGEETASHCRSNGIRGQLDRPQDGIHCGKSVIVSPCNNNNPVFLDDDVGAGGGEPGHSCQDDGDNADNESWISGTGGLQLGSVVEKSSEDERACGGGQVLQGRIISALAKSDTFGEKTWIARERRAAEMRPMVSTSRPILAPNTITESYVPVTYCND